MLTGELVEGHYYHGLSGCRPRIGTSGRPAAQKDMYCPPVPILSQNCPSVQWILLRCRGTIYQRKPFSAVSLVRNGIK